MQRFATQHSRSASQKKPPGGKQTGGRGLQLTQVSGHP